MASSAATLVTAVFLILLPASLAAPNITDILVNGGQFKSFFMLLNTTQIIDRFQIQLNTTNDGITIFAPNDNAFSSLPAGTINNITPQQQTELALAHALPKAYTFDTFKTASNPVLTLAGGNDTVTITAPTEQGQQWVNVSTGIVEVHITYALNVTSKLAIYPIEKVLLPPGMSGRIRGSPPATTSPGSPASTGTPKPTAGGNAPAGAPTKAPGNYPTIPTNGAGVEGRVTLWVAAGMGLVGVWFMGSVF